MFVWGLDGGRGGSLIRLSAFSLGLLRVGWGWGKGSKIKLHRADFRTAVYWKTEYYM